MGKIIALLSAFLIVLYTFVIGRSSNILDGFLWLLVSVIAILVTLGTPVVYLVSHFREGDTWRMVRQAIERRYDFIKVNIYFGAILYFAVVHTRKFQVKYDYELLPTIAIAGVVVVLALVGYGIVVSLVSDKKARYIPVGVGFVTVALLVAGTFHAKQQGPQIFNGSAATVEEAITRSFCPNSDILHPLVVYIGEEMKRKLHCTKCWVKMQPLTPQIALAMRIKDADPDYLPAYLGAVADSIARAERTVEKPDTGWIELRPDTSMVPRSMNDPGAGAPTVGSTIHRPVPFSPLTDTESQPSVLGSIMSRWGAGGLLGIFLFAALICLWKMPERYRLASVGVLAFVYVAVLLIGLTPKSITERKAELEQYKPARSALFGSVALAAVPLAAVSAAQADPLAQSVLAEPSGHSISSVDAVRVTATALLTLAILLATFFFIWGKKLAKTWGAAVTVLVALTLMGLRPHFFWTADNASWWRYEAFPLYVGIFVLFTGAVLIWQAKRGRWEWPQLGGFFALSTVAVLLTWMVVGVQPPGLAPNQHTEAFDSPHSSAAGRSKVARAETLEVDLDVLSDRKVVFVPEGCLISVLSLDDHDQGITLWPLGYEARYGLRFGIATTKADQRATPTALGWKAKDLDMWRAGDRPKYWPVMMIDRGSLVFPNRETKWVALAEGVTYPVKIGGVLVLGLNIAENTDDQRGFVKTGPRNPYHTGYWTVRLVVEQKSSLTLTGLSL